MPRQNWWVAEDSPLHDITVGTGTFVSDGTALRFVDVGEEGEDMATRKKPNPGDAAARSELRIIDYFHTRPQKGLFGVELELVGNNLPLQTAPKGWVPKQEDSLQGRGCEYVTDGARNRAQLTDDLHVLNETFRRAGVNVVEGDYRASTHIHVNMQQETFKTLFGIVIAHTIIEPVLMRLCGSRRDGVHFCLSSYDTGDLPDFADSYISYLQGGGGDGFDRGKYASLNTAPVAHYGSVEFRSFPSTVDAGKILMWCRWVENMLNEAKGCPDPTFTTLLNRAQARPIEYAEAILTGVPDLQNQMGATGLMGMVHFGCENAYELVRRVRPLFEVKK